MVRNNKAPGYLPRNDRRIDVGLVDVHKNEGTGTLLLQDLQLVDAAEFENLGHCGQIDCFLRADTEWFGCRDIAGRVQRED
jgi:hypothetical protein